ncbi:MAG: hypothetical protein WCK24_03990, partial [Actinomycetes bacterium]
GGPKFLIESGVSGFLIDPKIQLGFTSVLENLLRDDALSARIAESGRRSVLNKSWKSNNEKLLGFYDEALELTRQRISSELLVA